MSRSQSKRPLIPSVRGDVMVIGRSVSWLGVDLGQEWEVMMMEARIQRVGGQDVLAAVRCCAL